MLKLYITNSAGERYNISPIVKDKNVKLTKTLDNFAATLEFELAYNNIDKLPINPIKADEEAVMVELYCYDNIIFQGIIPKGNINKNNPKYTSYDPTFYILKTADIFQFKKLEAGECIRTMLKQFKCPIGAIEASTVKIDEYYYKETIGDIIKKIIEQIKQDSGDTFHFYFKNNAYHFTKSNKDKYQSGEYTAKKCSILLNNKYVSIFNFIKDPSYDFTWEEMKNSVVVVDGDDKKVNKTDTAKDENSIKKFGLLQMVVKQEKNDQKNSSKKK